MQDELTFVSWFQGGEGFRSLETWMRHHVPMDEAREKIEGTVHVEDGKLAGR